MSITKPTFKPIMYAFPRETDYGNNDGMTLRDYLAAKALQGIIMATADYEVVNAVATQVKGGALESKAAYQWADAMMAERDK